MSGAWLGLASAAVACAGAAGALAVPDDHARKRLGRLLAEGAQAAGRPSRKASGERPDVRLRLAVSGLCGLSCAVFLGGPVGAVAGALAAALCFRVLARLEPRAVRLRRARMLADLPVAIDLLAACLRCGAPWHESVEAVAAAIGGPLGAELERVAARIRLGVDPAQEWLDLAREPVMAPLGRAAARAAAGGVPIAATLTRLARDQRRKARMAAADRARVAGVRAVMPLGLCFLPAFVLLSVVPAIAGMVTSLPLP